MIPRLRGNQVADGVEVPREWYKTIPRPISDAMSWLARATIMRLIENVRNTATPAHVAAVYKDVQVTLCKAVQACIQYMIQWQLLDILACGRESYEVQRAVPCRLCSVVWN